VEKGSWAVMRELMRGPIASLVIGGDDRDGEELDGPATIAVSLGMSSRSNRQCSMQSRKSGTPEIVALKNVVHCPMASMAGSCALQVDVDGYLQGHEQLQSPTARSRVLSPIARSLPYSGYYSFSPTRSTLCIARNSLAFRGTLDPIYCRSPRDFDRYRRTAKCYRQIISIFAKAPSSCLSSYRIREMR